MNSTSTEDRLDSLALSGSQSKRISEFKNEEWEKPLFPQDMASQTKVNQDSHTSTSWKEMA